MTNEPMKQETATARQEGQKSAVLAELRKLPIVTIACERASVSRPTFYRMRDTDEKFRVAVADAIAEGTAFVTDMSEAQLIQLIKDKNFSAIQLWLRHSHPKYASKPAAKTDAKHSMEILTSEKEALVEHGIQLMTRFSMKTPSGDGENKNDNDHGSGTKQ